MSLVRRVAQTALGVPFIWMGWNAFSEPGGRVKAAEKLGLPEPELMVRFNGAAMIAGGLALVANVLPRAASAGLVAAMIPTTYAGHAFWKLDDPEARAAQRVQFLKNLGMVGGLLVVASKDD